LFETTRGELQVALEMNGIVQSDLVPSDAIKTLTVLPGVKHAVQLQNMGPVFPSYYQQLKQVASGSGTYLAAICVLLGALATALTSKFFL
jgi:hypothetical protein